MIVNFGIDLGTTNSVIARYDQGAVEVFKNPIGHKETLPSVVAFRSGRIIVGDKAKEYMEKDPRNVFGSFKRKMGTSESFWVESITDTKTPIELSALVLKELKNFIYTGETLDAAVITIPASFDTVQSNATRQAGHDAGFKEVFLLQEPIAASLAYVNKTTQEQPDQQWLVYDLGGGTFDVALVKTEHGEMRILDHQGDNFLGGVDFDNLIVEKIIVPYLQSRASFGNLEKELRSSSGKYNSLYYILLKKAEEAKVNLSSQMSAEIEFEIETPEGDQLDIFFSITREQFELCIREKIMDTVAMIRAILERNQLAASQLACILMVGGSTYIPLVRQLVELELGIPISTSIDPTTAVAVGAAYFAGTKKRSITQPPPAIDIHRNLKVKSGYSKVTQDKEEYFLAQVEGDWKGLFYRIVRTDGGFDTGLRELTERFTEYLPLVANMNNNFELRILDAQNSLVFQDNTINIVNGKYGIMGQPLPHDICIEIDDPENNATKLEIVFSKNSLLPLKKTLTKEVSKTIRKGSNDAVIINVLEGNHTASPLSNLSIGIIEVKGKDLTVDLIKGSDIEIVLEMSESRDLRITTYLMMTDQEFTNLFSPSVRHVSLGKLRDDLVMLQRSLEQETQGAVEREDYELSQQLNDLRVTATGLIHEIDKLPEDDVTDSKYQLEDKKKMISSRFDELTKDKKKMRAKTDYFLTRKWSQQLLDAHGTEAEKKEFAELISNEKKLMASDSALMIESVTKRMEKIVSHIRWRTPEHIIRIYYYYANLDDEYTDPLKARKLKEKGDQALERKNYEELKVIINQLYSLLPPQEQERVNIKGTGIV
jgi:molecular chaperone DnaK